MTLLEIADRLVADLSALRFQPPVTHVYNPLEYGREGYARYLERYGGGPRDILLLGMNPGPFGMAQTGVPFGDPQMVREFLGIDAEVGRPKKEHPARPVHGFGCKRREVSGQRVWGWARERYGTAEEFFRQFFVANYCPLVFMEDSGRNRTPDALPAAEKKLLFERCDRALVRTVECLKPKLVVGIGKFAEQRARASLGDTKVVIGCGLHPSPASPAANAGWAQVFQRQIDELWGAVTAP